MRLRSLRLLAGLAVIVVTPLPCLAQTQAPDLSQMSIEDLMQIEVTSASRKQQRIVDVPAAVFVITSDDIRRSGMTSLPDLLRLAPGVNVAQFSSNEWAVSVRGSNGLYANKLLVLVDGRGVYNRLFSGVFWDAQDMLLDDIDRIEVIRGPGAVMWGANAVNGVINIVTKAATDTRGGVARVEGGGFGGQAAVRYGGALGAARYRVYAQWTGRDQSLSAPGIGADDQSHSVTTGFRTDWTDSEGGITVEGAFVAGQTRALWFNLDPSTASVTPVATDPSDIQSGHLLGRYTRRRAGGASWQTQAFVDASARQEPVGDYHRHAFDIDTQYHATLGTRHDVVAGGSYRFVDEGLAGRVGFSLTPGESRSTLVTAFVQDEIGVLGNRLAFTLGSQVQHDSDSGVGVQPTGRVMWKMRPRQRLWAAASRALRTPSLANRGLRVEFPPAPSPSGLPLLVTLVGNPAAKTERFVDAEAGYRVEIGPDASIDLTGYMGRYQDLVTRELVASAVQLAPSPQVRVTAQFGNELEATTRGLEVAGRWAPLPAWHLSGSYTAFHFTPRLSAASLDPGTTGDEGSAPRNQWQLRSAFSPGTQLTVDVALFHVGALTERQVDAYTRVDFNAAWRLTRRVTLMAIGQNLLDGAHAEFDSTNAVSAATQVRRGVSLRLRWDFK